MKNLTFKLVCPKFVFLLADFIFVHLVPIGVSNLFHVLPVMQYDFSITVAIGMSNQCTTHPRSKYGPSFLSLISHAYALTYTRRYIMIGR